MFLFVLFVSGLAGSLLRQSEGSGCAQGLRGYDLRKAGNVAKFIVDDGN